MAEETSDPARSVRIGDEERNRAAEALGAHLRAGRLAAAEYDDRMQQTFAARTSAEIDPLFFDLPGGSPLVPHEDAGPAPGQHSRRRFVLPGIIVMLVLAGGITWSITHHVPPFFLLPLVVFALARRRGFAFGQPRPDRPDRRR